MKKGKKNVLIIGEAPDEDEATHTLPRSAPAKRKPPLLIGEDADDDDATEVMGRATKDSATEPVKRNPLLEARDVRIGPLVDSEEDETAPINKDALARARALPPEATWPPENKRPTASGDAPVIFRGTVEPGRTAAFQMEGPGPRVRPLGAVQPLDFEPAPERPTEDPVVLRGTVVPGKTASFFLGEGEARPDRWRLRIRAPSDAVVTIDGVECGRGEVTIEGEALGLNLAVMVTLPSGASWVAHQAIEALARYELLPRFD